MFFDGFLERRSRPTQHPELCSDIECWRAIVAGGKARDWGYTQLYLRYEGSLKRKFSKLSLSGVAVEDLVHDVFVKIIKNCHAYREDRAFSEWLLTIAQNTLTDHLRKTGHKMVVEKHSGDNADQGIESLIKPAENPTNVALQECVQTSFLAFEEQFPERAHVIKLAVFEGHCNKELARIIDKELGNAREYLSQCRKKFRPFLNRCRIYLQEDVS